jgi:ribonucleotide monophosphatase NagD (HAD superfamily)
MLAPTTVAKQVPMHDVAMVGDDLQADIGGAQAIGIRGFMVRTGKFRADEVEASPIVPDRVIDSVASLPGLLLG